MSHFTKPCDHTVEYCDGKTFMATEHGNVANHCCDDTMKHDGNIIQHCGVTILQPHGTRDHCGAIVHNCEGTVKYSKVTEWHSDIIVELCDITMQIWDDRMDPCSIPMGHFGATVDHCAVTMKICDDSRTLW
ncbi:hypothetical protein NN561_007861 [Cricetulus griseus]